MAIDHLLPFGAPMSVTATDGDACEDCLRAYATTYLVDEIRTEGLVRDLGSYSRSSGCTPGT